MLDGKRYLIEGGRKLSGVISVAGAKNAISKQLVASLLTEEPCVFTNVPRITEIDVLLEMLAEVGTTWEWRDAQTLVVQTPRITCPVISQKYSGFNRNTPRKLRCFAPGFGCRLVFRSSANGVGRPRTCAACADGQAHRPL